MADRLKIAAITTIYHKYSHTQHIVDRFLEGYGWNGQHHRPEMDVVSLYVDQVEPRPKEGADENSSRYDLSEERAERFPQMKIYPTVADALTLGTGDLQVDGVLLVAEHGSYRRNEKGQHLYPRYELFKQIVSVYRTTGKTAPVFNDKHLSWNWDWCQEMYDLSKELDFAFMAGSSLPVTWRTPSIEMPLGAEVEEAVCVCYGGVDSYDYHGLETTQCMIERRKGGETGVKQVQMIEGDDVWKALDEGRFSRRLLEAALSRSDTPCGKTDEDGRTQDLLGNGELPVLVEKPAAYFIEHNDGLKTTLLMLNGAIKDFCFACEADGEIVSTQFFLSPTPNVTYSACLVAKIEEMIETGAAPFPAERTLIVSGALESCLTSKVDDHKTLETPHLSVVYEAPDESHHARF